MTTFKIKTEILVRLASICDFFEISTDDETKKLINTVRLENKSGHSFAISTNQKIAAVQYLGVTEHPDGVAHVKLEPEMMKALQNEVKSESIVTLSIVPFILSSTLETNLGYKISDCVYWFDETPLNDWRSWIVPNATKSSRPMYWNLFQVESLIRASPSGKIVFPEFIDAEKPVTIKDVSTYDWIGLFIPDKGEAIAEEAKVPSWWGK